MVRQVPDPPASRQPDQAGAGDGIVDRLPEINEGRLRRIATGLLSEGAGNIAADGVEVPFQPWAEEVYKTRLANNGKGVPSERCLPHQLPKAYILAEPTKIVQTPGLVVILHEEFNNYRRVFTDGRQFPPDLDRRWMGYSIGKWEGDTLGVDTRGFVDETWLDFGGHPATDALHVVERSRRRDFGQYGYRIYLR